MKTMDARKLHLATIPLRLTRRHSVAAFVITLCLFPPGRVLASDGSSSRLGAGQDTASPNARPGTTAWIRVAEGEYKVLTENGIGPFNPAVYGFSESWTLWRLPDGSFEVNGTKSYRSPSDEPHSNEFSVHLSRDFRVLRLKEFRRLRWRSDSGPLSCTFLPGKIACTSNARDVTQNVTLDLPMDNTFGFMWPISAFSLGSITRSASHKPKVLTPVERLRLDEVSRADPIMTTILSGHLRYLGQEGLLLADHKWRADKFELKVPLHAPFLLWTSPEGLLLAFSPETKNKILSGGGMALVRFQQWMEF
jgi:hypothetical protein